jgi:hypothetical protein
MDHRQGPGNLIHIPCEVFFDVVIPNDNITTPYIIFISHGIHSHPPPPPNKPPKQMVDEVLAVIQRIRSPSLTLGINTFLTRF